MKLLLDTQAFLWWIIDSDQLSPRARRLIGSGQSEIFFSAASAWEIIIKVALGRVTLPSDPETFIPQQLSVNGFQTLSVHLRHALRVHQLPPLHRDPFDRLLVAQALVEGLAIVSSDRQLTGYPAKVIW